LKIDKLLAGTLALVLIAGFGTPAFAGAQNGGDPCEDCETQLDVCLAGTGEDPIKDSQCVETYKSCLEDDMCPIDACIQCDFDAANCILTSDQSQSAIEACFAIFDSCLETNQCFDPSVGGELIPIESTSLILAGAQSFSWMIPVVLDLDQSIHND